MFGASASQFSTQYQNRAGLEQLLVANKWNAAVRDVSLEIAEGEVFVIMGLSGSGKSTLVRCFTRLIEPTKGVIQIGGQDLLAASPKKLIEIRRNMMGMVFQHFALLPNRTVLGNVEFPLQVQGVDRETRVKRARKMIELVGLGGKEEQYPAELSGGQQQRVGIARSLSTDPSIWFLDEPFSALDPLIRADLQDELLRLQRQLKKTVVFITHDLDEAIKISDRMAIMQNGEVIQSGRPEEIVLNPKTEYVAKFTHHVPRAKVMRVSQLMKAPPTTTIEIKGTLSANARIADVSAQTVGIPGHYEVVDINGKRIGILQSEDVISVLAGIDGKEKR